MNPEATAFPGEGNSAVNGALLTDEQAVGALKNAFPTWNRRYVLDSALARTRTLTRLGAHSHFRHSAVRSFSRHLQSYWESSGRKWDVAVREIALVESEISGAPAHKPRSQQPLQPTPVWTPAPAVGPAGDFPALGEGPRKDKRNIPASWASKAKAPPGGGLTLQQGVPKPKPPPGFSSQAPRSAHSAREEIWSSGVQQVSTGNSVAVEYADARASAASLAKARNAMFEAANAAYLRGDKALAKELGAKGREYNEQMHAQHAAAAEGIFEARNAGLRQADGRRVVDLHGLHVLEATRKVLDVIDTAKRAGEHSVDVVVGTGSHSKTNAGTLRRSIIDTVERAGYRWKENYAGLLRIQL